MKRRMMIGGVSVQVTCVESFNRQTGKKDDPIYCYMLTKDDDDPQWYHLFCTGDKVTGKFNVKNGTLEHLYLSRFKDPSLSNPYNYGNVEIVEEIFGWKHKSLTFVSDFKFMQDRDSSETYWYIFGDCVLEPV